MSDMTILPDAQCAVLIPSCSEPDIGQTIDSVGRQTYRPAVTVVVLNNCRDDGRTRRLAVEAAGRHDLNLVVLEMDHNPHMKAGALNFGYEWIRLNWPGVSCLIQMDADSVLGDEFIERSVRGFSKRSSHHKKIGVLSCNFVGKSNLATNKSQAVIMWLQRTEYIKYHDAAVTREVPVASGTGCALRVEALESVKSADRDYVWAVDSLVEDYELTLVLKKCGWSTRKSNKLEVYTDLMPTVKALVKQRERWQRGTNDELRRYGLERYTRSDIAKQLLHGAGMLLNAIAWFLIAFMVAIGQMSVSYPALGLMGLIMLRQAYHVRAMGWPTMLLVATLIPDTLYGVLRNYWWIKALVLSCGRSQKKWT